MNKWSPEVEPRKEIKSKPKKGCWEGGLERFKMYRVTYTPALNLPPNI